ncbi:peptidase C45 [Actinobacteria bacterium YIM 96077]|uniref:Peptidase C45 n=1 Tax=Phytoactinopolyspora halophila TaxID=1981511 RepID=A0A329QGU4_9ACTN|nr:C45 family peptidase [Phytoactinopolyspora halophila]AYY14705.1 peptidase C45 [Actinobacteria bacterium YIM 96077]RAW11584.1 peptidase C45 [Phytoactinopolyspora halophila]
MNPASIPTFESTETDPWARGREFGLAWASDIEATCAGYADLFRAQGAADEQVRSWGLRAVGQLETWAPEMADEIAGIADGANLELWRIGALNARTEIIAALRARGGSECSASVVVPEHGAPRTIQTWDWRDTLRHVPVAWSYDTGAGRAVRGFTEFGLLGKIGVNSDRVGVHFNILRHVSDHADIGVPVHAVARRILDRAGNIDDATTIARSAWTSASSVISVVAVENGRGRVRGLELCPDGVGVVEPDADGFYAHTNHFLDSELASGELQGIERPGTYQRLRHLRSHIDGLASEDLDRRVAAMRSHAVDGAAVCCHASPEEPFHERSETLATISLDLDVGQLWLHRGGPCQVSARTWQRC